MDLLFGIANAVLSDGGSSHGHGGRGGGQGSYYRHSRYGGGGGYPSPTPYTYNNGAGRPPQQQQPMMAAMNQQQIYQQVQSIFGPMAFLHAAPVTQQQQAQYAPTAGGGVRPHRPYNPRAPYTQGRVKGLFIGINYKGVQGAELDGCVNDVSMMIKMLEQIDFPLQEAAILVDDRGYPNNSGQPTRANIIQHMQWLVDGARPGDCLFFHFSGHGSQTKDASGDETDGMDETLVPVDYKTAGCIIDDDIYRIMCSRLPAGVRLTAVMDCCHSGTLMDLPFSFEATDANMSYGGAAMHPVKPNTVPCAAEVVMFSGCADSQTSADVGNVSSFGNATAGYRVGNAGGACTNALTQVLTKTSGLTYMALFKEMRRVLKEKRYAQVPQLSASQPIDLNRPFSLFLTPGAGPRPPQQQVQYQPYQQGPPPGQYQQPPPPTAGQYQYQQQPSPYQPQAPYAQQQQQPPYGYNSQPPPQQQQQYNYSTNSPNPIPVGGGGGGGPSPANGGSPFGNPYHSQQQQYASPGGYQNPQTPMVPGYPPQQQPGYPGYPQQPGGYGVL